MDHVIPATASVGAIGESIAAGFLIQRGCIVVARNVRVGSDEVDLVVDDGGAVAAVEVKCSTNDDDPLEAVDDVKFSRVERAAAALTRRVDRIDLVGVRIGTDQVSIRWLRGVC